MQYSILKYNARPPSLYVGLDYWSGPLKANSLERHPGRVEDRWVLVNLLGFTDGCSQGWVRYPESLEDDVLMGLGKDEYNERSHDNTLVEWYHQVRR